MGWSPYRATGLTHHQPSQSFKGYTLMAPIRGDATYLLDMGGRIVHRWRHEHVYPFFSRLLDNGNLLTLAIDRALPPPPQTPFDQPPPPFAQHIRRIGGNATHLIESDWDGKVVWEYHNESIHHDVARLPNGNTVVIEWVELPPDLARRVRGGVRRPREKFPPMLGDDFVEIDAQGNEVARLHLWAALNPIRDPIGALHTRWEWTHTNSLDLTADGHLLFSCRHTSTVGILERPSGRLLWTIGAPEINDQHHATVLSNANIQIFDNGTYRVGVPRSRVVEINPSTSKVEWEYVAEPEISFFSPHISGAHRLPDGNVLVTEGGSGRLFEVTRRGEIVWEWISPFVQRLAGRANSWVFRAYRYGPDHPGLAGRSLNPDAHADLNRLHGL